MLLATPYEKAFWTLLTCHFRQPGLNEGLPKAASVSLINTYKVGSFVGLGVRWGSSLGAYVRTGTLSNSLFTGAGIEKKSRTLLACLAKELELELELGEFLCFPFSSSGGIGIELCYQKHVEARISGINYVEALRIILPTRDGSDLELSRNRIGAVLQFHREIFRFMDNM